MAIKLKDEYPGQVITSDPAYPHGKAKNEDVPDDGTGTPLEELWVNDHVGMMQAMLDRAGIEPSGQSEKVGASQFLDALDLRFGGTGNLTTVSSELQNGLVTGRILNVSPVDSDPRSATVSGDGSKLYVVGQGVIHQYGLSEPYNQESGTFEVTWSAPLHQSVWRIVWKPDGTRFYVLGRDSVGTTWIIRDYSPTAAWSLVGSPSAEAVRDITANFISTSTLSFSPDGTAMYVGGNSAGGNDVVTEWAINPWDITGGSLIYELEVDVPGLTSFTGHSMSEDGRRLFLSNTENLTEYHLATPYRTASAFLTGRVRDLLAALGERVWAPQFSPNSAHSYIVANGSAKVFSVFASAVRQA